MNPPAPVTTINSSLIVRSPYEALLRPQRRFLFLEFLLSSNQHFRAGPQLFEDVVPDPHTFNQHSPPLALRLGPLGSLRPGVRKRLYDLAEAVVIGCTGQRYGSQGGAEFVGENHAVPLGVQVAP